MRWSMLRCQPRCTSYHAAKLPSQSTPITLQVLQSEVNGRTFSTSVPSCSEMMERTSDSTFSLSCNAKTLAQRLLQLKRSFCAQKAQLLTTVALVITLRARMLTGRREAVLGACCTYQASS